VSGQLVVVATPIGNLSDVSRRAMDVLERADAVYCEDTRHSRTLFAAYEIPVNGRLHALHEHNEASQCAQIVARVAAGETVAIVSDAGTPGISDPGARVVAAVAQAGLLVTTTPGPSAVIAALSISGLATERFCMEGFLPRKAGERNRLFTSWANEPRTIVFFESPQRVLGSLRELATLYPSRRIVLAREITKRFEEVRRGTLDDVLASLENDEVRGEIVLVLEGAAPLEVDDDTLRRALRELLRGGVSVRDAATSVANDFGVSHRHVYEMALADQSDNAS